MTPDGPIDRRQRRRAMQREVASKQQRKLAARREGEHSAWFGLGMFGLVGWSVAIPTLIGISIGLWIDEQWPSRFSWTLMLLVFGVFVGCLNAWWWVQRESQDLESPPSHEAERHAKLDPQETENNE